MAAPVVRLYDAASFAPLEEWAGLSSVSVAYDERGPASAEIAVPRGADYLLADRVMPGGQAAWVEIDARDLGADAAGRATGVPDVWLGRLSAVQASRRGATCSVSCVGPSAWLEEITVAQQGNVREPAALIARRLLEQYPHGRVTAMPNGYRGLPGEAEVGGQPLWSALTGLADGRGEAFRLRALPGQARLLLEWTHPSLAEDRTGLVVLAECEWDAAYQLDGAVLDLLGVADSYAAGAGQVASAISAPLAIRRGRHAALTAEVQSAAAASLLEGGELIVRPDVPTRAELALLMEAQLRQQMVPPILLQCEVQEPHLWPYLDAGVLVRVDIDEPLGIFSGGAVGRVLDRAYDLLPTLTCRVGIELWSEGDE